jgi:hypothetical protein
MIRDILEPPSSLRLSRNAPYNLPLAASASSSASSFWSDVSSQHSDDSVSTAPTSYSDSTDSFYFSHTAASSQTSVSSVGSAYEPAIKLLDPWATKSRTRALAQPELPADLRQNPRRTSASATSRTGRPPSLVRQSERKLSFVENLVGKENRPPVLETPCSNNVLPLSRHLHPYRRGHLAHLLGASSQ